MYVMVPYTPGRSWKNTVSLFAFDKHHAHYYLARKKGIPPPEVVAETLLFQVGLVTAFDIGRQPVPAPAPAGAVPAPAAPAANGRTSACVSSFPSRLIVS